MYYPVDVPSSVSMAGSESLSRLRSFAYAPRLKYWAQGRGVGIYKYPGGTPSIVDVWDPLLSLGGTGGDAGGCGVGSGVGCLSHSGGGAPVHLHHQHVLEFCAVPCWQRTQPSVWFSPSIARCLSIAAFKFSSPGNSTPHFSSSRTSTWGWFHQVLCFLCCGVRKPSFGHFGHIQGMAHVRLF